MLALPFLESLMRPGRSSAQATPPRRFVLMFFGMGLVRTKWKPRSPGALPASGDISELLAPLNDLRNNITVVSDLGNPARHVFEGDNHRRTNTTILTNARPQDDQLGGGESVDQAAARLLSAPGMRPSVLLPVAQEGGPSLHFSEVGGVVSPVTRNPSSPREAAEFLFASLPGDPMETGAPSLRERLTRDRGSVIDAVSGNLGELRRRLPASDRAILDAHAEHLHALTMRNNMPPSSIACEAPDLSTLPSLSRSDGSRRDNESAPAQIDNLVRAMACDITRVGSIYFNAAHDPRFPWLFGGSESAAVAGFDNWHDMIHNGQTNGADSDPGVPNLVRGQTFYIEQFAYLIRRLQETPDIDGQSTLFDNTLVLFMTDFGHHNHGTYDIPAILAGMPSQVALGQYVQARGHTIGDLHNTVLSKLGAPAGTTLGLTGPINWGSLSETWAWSGDPVERFDNGLLPV